MVEYMAFCNDHCGAGGADAYHADKRRERPGDFACHELGNGNGCGIIPHPDSDRFDLCIDGFEPDRSHGGIRIGKRPGEQHRLLLGSECDQCGRHKCMVGRLEFYDGDCGAFRSGAGLSHKRFHEPSDLADLDLGHGDERRVLWFATVNYFDLCVHGVESERPCRGIRPGERPIQRHSLLLAGQCDECGRYQRLVGCLEFHDDRGGADSADTFLTDKWCNRSIDLANHELGCGYRCGIL